LTMGVYETEGRSRAPRYNFICAPADIHSTRKVAAPPRSERPQLKRMSLGSDQSFEVSHVSRAPCESGSPTRPDTRCVRWCRTRPHRRLQPAWADDLRAIRRVTCGTRAPPVSLARPPIRLTLCGCFRGLRDWYSSGVCCSWRTV